MKTVVITDLRTREAQDAAGFLAVEGYDVRSVPDSVPLWDEEALSGFARTVASSLAGVIHPAPPLFLSPLLDTTEEAFARGRDEGPLSAWCVTKVFGALFREKRDGCLIYLNSIHAEKPVGHGFLFSIGCGAVQMLAREVNQDYGTAGVRSYFIQRGPTASDPDARTELSDMYYGVDLRYPTRQMPAPGALNPLLAFLLSPGAAPLAGSDLRADGGMVMYYGERVTEQQLQEIRKKMKQEKQGGTVLGES